MIRTALFDDLDALVELSRQHHAAEYGDMPFDAAHVRENYRARSIDTMDGICLVAEEQGRIVGCLAAATMQPFNARIKVAAALALYVADNCAARHGKVLIAEFEAWARERGCVRVALSYPATGRSAALHRYYGGLGYVAFEHTYLKAL